MANISVVLAHPDLVSGESGLPNPFKKIGRIAQLVQSTWFTPKGSGVRIPLRPQKVFRNEDLFLF